MLTHHLKKLIKHEHLNAHECTEAIEAILSANNPEQISAFLMLMRAKGETANEMIAFIQFLRDHQIQLNLNIPVLDIVGTGGDGANTVNISTAASILAASCGVTVLKHGNRAASSHAGAADVLEALGLRLDQSPDEVVASLYKHNMGFCFAPNFLSVLSKIKLIRSQLKVPTLFNLLGPLLNPGKPEYMILGVFNPNLMQLVADCLVHLHVKRAMVVHGNGLDELNCLGPCEVIEIYGSDQKYYQLDPVKLGLPRCQLSDLAGGNAQHNAVLIDQVLNNQPSHLANTVMLNAAAAVYLFGKANNLEEGLSMVRASISQGLAKHSLRRLCHE